MYVAAMFDQCPRQPATVPNMRVPIHRIASRMTLGEDVGRQAWEMSEPLKNPPRA